MARLTNLIAVAFLTNYFPVVSFKPLLQTRFSKPCYANEAFHLCVATIHEKSEKGDSDLLLKSIVIEFLFEVFVIVFRCSNYSRARTGYELMNIQQGTNEARYYHKIAVYNYPTLLNMHLVRQSKQYDLHIVTLQHNISQRKVG